MLKQTGVLLLAFGAITAIVYLVLSVLVWRKQGYDVGLEATHLTLTLVMWVVFGVLIQRCHAAYKFYSTEQVKADNRSGERIASLIHERNKLTDDIANLNVIVTGLNRTVKERDDRINTWETTFVEREANLNRIHAAATDDLTKELLGIRKNYFKTADTGFLVECAMLGTDRTEPIDVTTQVKQRFDTGNSVPVSWQFFGSKDPLEHGTKFLTVVFSITKRESNFVDFPVEKATTQSSAREPQQ